MIEIPEIVVERIAVVPGGRLVDNAGSVDARTIAATGFRWRRVAADGETLLSLALSAARKAVLPDREFSGVVVATYSNPERFPGLAVRLAGELGLPSASPAIDLQAACAAYPQALYVAGRLAADSGGRVLVVDGDVQSPLVNGADAATAPLFSDAVSATVVSADPSASSCVGFLTQPSDALRCLARGPVEMDGFKVFSFVAGPVVDFLRTFGTDFDWFAPHQANKYLVRQLARALGLEHRLLVPADDALANPGSCSAAAALAAATGPGRALVAGFGAGFSACACTVRILAEETREGRIESLPPTSAKGQM